MNTCDTLQFRKLLQVDAADSILCKLAHLPQVEKFATRVCAFYSDFLEYYEGTELTSSRYQINLQNEPVTLKSVRIELQIRSPRFVEALVHELLHLGVRMNGFPIGHAFTVPYEINRHADYFIGYYPKFVNILEHELIINDFLSFGFDKKTSLAVFRLPQIIGKLLLQHPILLDI